MIFKAALQERRAVEKRCVIEEELTSSGEHIAQLNEEIGQLQLKLDDAKASEGRSVAQQGGSSRIQVKKQVQRNELDDTFANLNASSAK